MAKVETASRWNRKKIGALVGVAVVGLAAIAAFYAGMKANPNEDLIIPSGTPTPSITPVASPPAGNSQPAAAAPAPPQFDGCGTMDKYRSEPWFASFNSAVRYAAEMCFARSANLVVYIDGQYRVGRYNTQTGDNQLAHRNMKGVARVNHGLASAAEFGAQSGDTVEFLERTGAPSCQYVQTFAYHFLTNQLELVHEEGCPSGSGNRVNRSL